MAKVNGPFQISGQVSKKQDAYFRTISKTGKSYVIPKPQRRKPHSANQKKSSKAFAKVIPAICQWIKENKAANTPDYQEVMRMYDAQDKYAFLRGFMYAKGMFEVIDEDTVKVDIHTRSSFKDAFDIRSNQEQENQ